ncbi:hypothetical protein [Undibacterium griseum]|uniref:Uncharacterized protein n=1 Tax=Undibacterium griseum TaxID=2762295 RepID=A0ABR6YLQ8_9BURK|nr:hypothetical protein [Undibacterium griseum]MBC3884739.1 hypothetical protein [Undibacterium griseum]
MEKSIAVSKALEQQDIPLSGQTVLHLMKLASLVEEAEYVSSSGSGEIKSYSRLTPSGLKYGENKKTMSPTKTDITIYPSKIKEILIECHSALGVYLSTL